MDFDYACDKYELMIHHMVGKYNIVGFEHEDLVNIGRYVMWTCCKIYKPELGLKFSTYLGKALQNECHKLYKYSQRAKRSKDGELKSMEDYCKGDMTYNQVVEQKDYGNIEEAKYELIKLTNRLPIKDKLIMLDFLHHKLEVNEELTIKDYCEANKISYVKMRRILDDFRYVISVEWGL